MTTAPRRSSGVRQFTATFHSEPLCTSHLYAQRLTPAGAVAVQVIVVPTACGAGLFATMATSPPEKKGRNGIVAAAVLVLGSDMLPAASQDVGQMFAIR